jgi:urease accessory protein
LRDGDVLTADATLVVVSLEPVDAMVVDFDGVEGDPTEVATAALSLGHAVGNRHWDLAVEGHRAYLPVTERPERMEDEVTPHLPDGVTVGYDEVSPAMFDDEGSTDHDHVHGHSHDGGHGHGEGHGHGHSHGDDHTHDHSHSDDHPVHGIDPDGGDPE